MKFIQSILAFAVLFVSVSNAQDPEHSFKETYEVSVPAQLMISTSDGNIDVTSSPGNKIEVFFIATKNNEVLHITREELEKELILEVLHERNDLKITVKYRNEHLSFIPKDRIEVNFRINTPRETVTNLNTSDGNVSLDGLDGEQQCRTSDGNIRIDNVSGSVVGKTSDGDVSVRQVKGPVEIATSDGNINLSYITGDIESSTSDGNIVLANINGNTSAKTSDGNINFSELSGSFDGVTSDGNIRGNFVELKKQLTVRTGDGNIDITLPGQLGLDLDITGESLHIPLNNFSGRSDERVIRGKQNGGGIPVNLSASDGRVTLAYRP